MWLHTVCRDHQSETNLSYSLHLPTFQEIPFRKITQRKLACK